MEIGIGLPNAIAGTVGRTLLEFARAGRPGWVLEPRHGRPARVYGRSWRWVPPPPVTDADPGCRPGAERHPYRLDAALRAKQLATLDMLSGGRL